MEKRFGSSRTRRDVNELIEAVGGQGCRVYNSADISIPSGVATVLSFDAEHWDTDGFHDAAQPDRLTCRRAGTYVVTGHVRFYQNSDGRRLAYILYNGSLWIAAATGIASSSYPADISVSTVYRLAMGDVLQLVVLQDSGVALSVLRLGNRSPEFAMVRIGG